MTTSTCPNAQSDGHFGVSVAVSGTTVVVGAREESAGTPAQTQAGNAYVFDATDGSLITTLTSPNAQTNGHFGVSVAVTGTTPIVVARAPCAGARAPPAAGSEDGCEATAGCSIPTPTTPNEQARAE